jgi:hypothetical protein
MGIILVGLAALTIIAFVALLAVLRAGIWQQERAASLVRRPHGLSAALARRICGMYAEPPKRAAHRTARPRPADIEPTLAARRNGSAV